MRILVILFGLLAVPVQAHSISPYDEIADRLSQQLVLQLNKHQGHQGYAQLGITRWVMSDTLALPTPENALYAVSHELSELLYSHLAERNVQLIDFRAQNGVTMTSAGSTMLTNDKEKLNLHPQLDWVLVGTMSREEDGVMLSIRVLDRRSQSVLAAANHYVPKHLYWTNKGAEIVNGHLQRSR
ncbi:hypothetical protein DFP83_105105 [Idiomarina fontislapidosi]|uniref:FlgO domain-containing protein n=1 Tax=Idiomarina fontislapidosi TaxID=263723 RepID=A0A432XYE5_9GAMM|nr:FlgO family outer membrane protein [Idiomarina fontislapidosi]PYE32797.1 hypothetical protein DFP83_105105 [Idiomarina fontislapidosi]RUO53762.1 hypothetical protein CWE25_07685 [Idiomarina fontislapidosi]|tara:strand:- start:7098 stop:7649 length:552 start_codon:yes stop_codon:yes gene_type:complete